VGCSTLDPLSHAATTRVRMERIAVHAPQSGRLTTLLTGLRQTIRAFWWKLRCRPSCAQEPGDDPMLEMLASMPIDGEPLTDEDRRNIDVGWQAYRDGQVVTAEEVRRRSHHTKGEPAKRRAAAV
jgi:hypothetical protein